MADWNCYLIGELKSVGVLAIKAHGNDGQIVFLDYEGDPPWPRMGDSLAGAVKDLLTQRATGR